MAQTVRCRACGTIEASDTKICRACNVRHPGRNPAVLLGIWTIVVLFLLSSGVIWLWYAHHALRLGVGLTIAAACALTFRVIVPALLRAPRVRPGSLVDQINSLQIRVHHLGGQLKSLADAYRSARRRADSPLINVTKERLKQSYSLLKRYHSRFDAHLRLLQFSLWLQETADIISGWRQCGAPQLSALCDRLSLRTQNCRVAYAALISGKLTTGVYSHASASIREGLSRVELVADAMVARKAQLALALVSPASIPADYPHESILMDIEMESNLRSTDDLEHEFDRIMAEHDLGLL